LSYLKLKSALSLSALICFSGCSYISDDFSYEKTKDEFTKEVTISAASSMSGDIDKEANLDVTLECNYIDGNEPDPIANTSISFLTSDKKGEAYSFSDIGYKINDGAVIPYAAFKDLNNSKYSNEISLSFVDLGLAEVFLQPELQGLLVAGAAGAGFEGVLSAVGNVTGDSQLKEYASSLPPSYPGLLGMMDGTVRTLRATENSQSGDANTYLDNSVKKIVKIIENAFGLSQDIKSISVRYETKDGMVNTTTLKTADGNFKKVLSECGWDKMGGNKYSERLKQFTIALQKQRAAAEAKAAAEVAAAEAEAEAAAAEMPSEDGADDTMPTAPGIAPRGDVTRRNSSSNYYEQ
jgi:hypothetical protein